MQDVKVRTGLVVEDWQFFRRCVFRSCADYKVKASGCVVTDWGDRFREGRRNEVLGCSFPNEAQTARPPTTRRLAEG